MAGEITDLKCSQEQKNIELQENITGLELYNALGHIFTSAADKVTSDRLHNLEVMDSNLNTKLGETQQSCDTCRVDLQHLDEDVNARIADLHSGVIVDITDKMDLVKRDLEALKSDVHDEVYQKTKEIDMKVSKTEARFTDIESIMSRKDKYTKALQQMVNMQERAVKASLEELSEDISTVGDRAHTMMTIIAEQIVPEVNRLKSMEDEGTILKFLEYKAKEIDKK